MNSKDLALKAKLESLVKEKNTQEALFRAPDPLQIARKCKDEFEILLCALFAYGSAKNILKFLEKLDFSLLTLSEKSIEKECKNLKYRFQNSNDIAQIFITLRRMKQELSLEELFTRAYLKDKSVLSGIQAFMRKIRKINAYKSYGYDFFFSNTFETLPKSPLKRYNLFLRWLVRKDELDLGRWRKIHTKDLLIPLDTQVFAVATSEEFSLLKREIYDFKSVLELTNKLKEFDPNDPVKYDFALYRLGQEKS